MSPEEKELLNRAVVLGEENNRMLRSIERSIRIGRIFKIIYWVIIIGSTVGAFYLVQPYFESLLGIYGGVSSGFGDYGDLLNSLK